MFHFKLFEFVGKDKKYFSFIFGEKEFRFESVSISGSFCFVYFQKY